MATSKADIFGPIFIFQIRKLIGMAREQFLKAEPDSEAKKQAQVEWDDLSLTEVHMAVSYAATQMALEKCREGSLAEEEATENIEIMEELMLNQVSEEEDDPFENLEEKDIYFE